MAGENWQGMLEAVKNPRPKRKYKKRKIRGFTSAETNKLLGLGTMRSFHRLTASGDGPPRVRIGREDWFPASRLAKWILSKEKGAVAAAPQITEVSDGSQNTEKP